MQLVVFGSGLRVQLLTGTWVLAWEPDENVGVLFLLGGCVEAPSELGWSLPVVLEIAPSEVPH